MQALADSSLAGLRIDRLAVGENSWEGPGIAADPPSKNKPFWTFTIWDETVVIAANIPILITATRVMDMTSEEEVVEDE